jgi:hypothetical protein
MQGHLHSLPRGEPYMTQEQNLVNNDDAQEHGRIPHHINDDLCGSYCNCKAYYDTQP